MTERIVGNYRPPRGRGASPRRPQSGARRWPGLLVRGLLTVAAVGLTGLIGYGAREVYLAVDAQRVTKVQIEGALHFLSHEALEETVNRFVETSMVALDLDQLKHELEARPWVSRADVRRQWPDRLIIRIEEEVPIARWGDGQLLNQQGRVFRPGEDTGQLQLPWLSGPEGSEAVVIQQYQQFSQLLYPLGLRLRDVELNERGAWTITLAPAVQDDRLLQVKVGRDEVLERMRRLVSFLESGMAERMPQLATIDLRYGNGLALGYRDAGSQREDAAALSTGLVVR